MKKLWSLGALWLLVIVGLVSVARAAQVCQKTDMYCYETGSSQNLSTVGRLDASGNLTVYGVDTHVGNKIDQPTQVSVTSQTVLSITAEFERVVSTGSAVTIIGISTTGVTDGTFAIIGSTSDVSTVVITSGTSSATGVGLGASTRTIDSKGKLGLMFDAFGNIWREVFYSAN